MDMERVLHVFGTINGRILPLDSVLHGFEMNLIAGRKKTKSLRDHHKMKMVDHFDQIEKLNFISINVEILKKESRYNFHSDGLP